MYIQLTHIQLITSIRCENSQTSLKSHMSIKIEELSFSYTHVNVLEHVNLFIEPGEYIGIMGPNGGGKTTLLKLIMGFLEPAKGEVFVNGKIGYVPQVQKTDRDFPISVHELILLGALSNASIFGTYPQSIKDQANLLMGRLNLTKYKNVMFGRLSGGLTQRALLARALVSDPDILLLDEPTANIDPISTKAIFEIIEELRGKKTILLITHDLNTIIERVGRVVCVKGRVTSFLPKDVCEHFAMGLYHSPLMGGCETYSIKEGKNVFRAP